MRSRILRNCSLSITVRVPASVRRRDDNARPVLDTGNIISRRAEGKFLHGFAGELNKPRLRVEVKLDKQRFTARYLDA